MPYDIKVRLARLQKTQQELYNEGKKRGMGFTYHNFNRIVNGHIQSKEVDKALEITNGILTEWEEK